MRDLMTPVELQEEMLKASARIDVAISEHRACNVDHVEKKRAARVAFNTALLTATGANAQERKARAEQGSEELLYAEEMSEALKDSAKEALRARMGQLNALQSLAYTIRAEMNLARG